MREIVLLVVPGAADLDVSLAMEMFTVANGMLDTSFFRVRILTVDGDEAVLTTRRRVAATCSLEDCQDVDFALVLSHINPNPDLMPVIHAHIRHLARVSGVIGGSGQAPLLLASAGLLKKRRATCHMDLLAVGRERFPEVRFVDQLWVHDGNVLTCAGHLSLVDMLVEFIQSTTDVDFARALSAELIAPVSRSSKMAQRCGNRRVEQTSDVRVRTAIDLMRNHIELPLSIPRVAEQVGLSARSLEAIWQKQIGISPREFYIRERVKYSCSLLLFSDLPITEIAHACGFSSGSSYARTFSFMIGIPPRQYRKQHGNKIAPVVSAQSLEAGPGLPPVDGSRFMGGGSRLVPNGKKDTSARR